MNLLSGLSILPLLTSLTVETVSEKDAFRVQDKNEIGRMVNNLNDYKAYLNNGELYEV